MFNFLFPRLPTIGGDPSAEREAFDGQIRLSSRTSRTRGAPAAAYAQPPRRPTAAGPQTAELLDGTTGEVTGNDGSRFLVNVDGVVRSVEPTGIRRFFV